MIVVAGVWHTGNNFVWQDLLNGMQQVSMNYGHYGKEQPPSNGFVRIHCDLGQSRYLKWWLSRYLCIVPMRHPLLVAESWKARERDLSLLPGQWEILKRDVAPHQPLYLPLDVADRQNWLDRLNESFGTNLQTDWPVIMSCKKTATLTEAERESVVEVMADGFFDRFGYEV